MTEIFQKRGRDSTNFRPEVRHLSCRVSSRRETWILSWKIEKVVTGLGAILAVAPLFSLKLDLVLSNIRSEALGITFETEKGEGDGTVIGV